MYSDLNVNFRLLFKHLIKVRPFREYLSHYPDVARRNSSRLWQLTNHSWTKHSKPSRATGVKVSLLGVQHFVKLKFNSSYVVSTDWHCLYLGTHESQYTVLINKFVLGWFFSCGPKQNLRNLKQLYWTENDSLILTF